MLAHNEHGFFSFLISNTTLDIFELYTIYSTPKLLQSSSSCSVLNVSLPWMDSNCHNIKFFRIKFP